jgi:hypothetical protein
MKDHIKNQCYIAHNLHPKIGKIFHKTKYITKRPKKRKIYPNSIYDVTGP